MDKRTDFILYPYATLRQNKSQGGFKMTEKELHELVKAEQRRYAREWRKKNPEKVAANKRRYWEKKALERIEKEKAEVD